MIRSAEEKDAEAIRVIYNHYVERTTVSFEELPLSLEAARARIAETLQTLPYLVLEDEGRVIGFAYARPWKDRAAFRRTVESSIYLAPDHVGRGLGRPLYEALIDALRSRSIHAVIAGITLPNPASVALHEALDFESAGRFKEVGWKFDRWLDVGYWILRTRA